MLKWFEKFRFRESIDIMKKIILLVVAIGLLSCKNETQTATTETDTTPKATLPFNNMLDNYYEDGLKLNPLSATMAGDSRYNDQFPDVLSPEHKAKVKAYYEGYKAALTQYNDADLSPSQKMTKAVMTWDCDVNLEMLTYQKDLMPIDQMWSAHLMVGQLASGASAQPFKTAQDYRNWQKRVDGYLDWLNSAERNMREGMTNGNVLPTSLIKKVIPQMEALAGDDIKQHLFYTPVTNFPEGISESDQKDITAAYTTMIGEKVIPAYAKMAKFMSTEYMEAGRETSGFSDLPNGDKYYDFAIKYFTTTTMSADEIHKLGLSEVARIRGEMEKIKEEVGFAGDLKAFFDHVRGSKDLMPFKTPEEVIANFNKMHATMKPKVDELFSLQPKTPFEVRRTEAFRENSASAEYNPGSLDGTRPGIFYTPIPDASKYNVYSDESLFLHEAIPGHHFQISLTQESKELPQFRKTLWYSAYGEGWALYTESLGKELGLYTDPYQYFGMLGAEMHRAVRLVVDTGIHTKGWTREQAIAYCLDNEAESEAGITSEIERYMANPGQALSYKIGQLKIRELRARAEKELGEAFDIKAFHKEVLETGCIPLALLEDKIDAWISASK